jgi:chromosome segregation ATPase
MWEAAMFPTLTEGRTTEDAVMSTTIRTIDYTQPKIQATRPALSFDTSRLVGNHDPDVQEVVNRAKHSLSESHRLFEIALGTIRTRTGEKLLAAWTAIQPEGRRLTDAIDKKQAAISRSENISGSVDNEYRTARLAVNKAKSVPLPKRPTMEELLAHDDGIAKAEAHLAEIKPSVLGAQTKRQQLAGELAMLQTELAEFEKREDKIAQEYKAIAGKMPGRVQQTPTAVQSTDGLLA